LWKNSLGTAILGCAPQVLAQISRKQDFWTQKEFQYGEVLAKRDSMSYSWSLISLEQKRFPKFSIILGPSMAAKG
jgi:hypothetical protein